MQRRKLCSSPGGRPEHFLTFGVLQRRVRPNVKHAQLIGSTSGDIVDAQEGEAGTIIERHEPSNSPALETCSFSAPDLPQEVLALILSKLPFPKIFTVKLLSKSWYYKLPSLNPVKSLANPPAATQGEEGNLILALVRAAADVGASDWCNLCPVFLSGMQIVGYDVNVGDWRKLPIHHGIREPLYNLFFRFIARVSWVKFAGPVLFVYQFCATYDEESKVLVANTLTGSWEVIGGFSVSCLTLPTECWLGPKDYKMVVHHLSQLYSPSGTIDVVTSVFDSRTRLWRKGESVLKSKVYNRLTDYNKKGMFTAFLEGNIYCMLGNVWTEKLELWRYNIETEEWAQVPVHLSFGEFDHRICGLFSVASEIIVALMVDCQHDVVNQDFSQSVLLYLLDVRTLQLSQPIRSPRMIVVRPAILHSSEVVNDSQNLYFVRSYRLPGKPSYPSDIWSFHVPTRIWTTVRPPPADYLRNSGHRNLACGAFVPGLNLIAGP